MTGAAVLATKACLRTGAGKVTVHTPKRNYNIMQISVPEAVLQMDHEETHFTESVDSDAFDSLAIGPGLGRHESSAIALIGQIKRTSCPIVIDADALNILGKHGYSSCPQTLSLHLTQPNLIGCQERQVIAVTND